MSLHSNIILHKEPPHYMIYWLILHFVLLFLLVLLASIYPIETKLEFIGYYQNNEVRTVVDNNFFLLSENKLIIQNTTYSYVVKKIEPIAYEEGNAVLWEVSITLDLPDNWKIDNHRFEISFVKSKTTILKQIVQKFRKETKI